MNATSNRTARKRVVVPAVVISVAAVMIALTIFLQHSSPSSSVEPSAPASDVPPATVETVAPAPGEEAEEVDLTVFERRDENDPLTAGSVDAPVGLVIFSDYQCPFCARWSADTLPVMMEYAERGELWIEYRDLPIFGAESERAPLAAYAAALQGKFWEYHEALYVDGDIRPKDQLTTEALTQLAVDLDLDRERFTADMTSEETAAAIATNAQLGFDLGASSTPVFLLGGAPIAGAQPTEVFVEVLETALANQG